MTLKEKYKQIIKSKQGVLYIKGNPGSGKSSIIQKIAEEEGLVMIDRRLSQIDSSEVIGLPCIEEINGIKVMGYAIPDWAYEANLKPTLIFFDEMNRAPLEIRNACLQMLLDRRIGHKFKFNDNVYFAAAGNLGEEDGTEVEEFDRALNGRLWIHKHELGITEWIDNYANKYVNKYIIDFLDSHPEYYYKTFENCDSFCNPRSWTFLSEFIGGIKEDNIGKISELVKDFGFGYIGVAFERFLRYLEETKQISIKDILGRFESVESDLKKLRRDRMNELVKNMEEVDINLLKEKEINNLISFLKIIHDDERIGYFRIITKDEIKMENNAEKKLTVSDNVRKLVKSFEEDFMKIHGIESKKKEK
jgi:hypothetical protein